MATCSLNHSKAVYLLTVKSENGLFIYEKLFPLNCSRRFAAYVINDPIDAFYLIDNFV